jgi:hypothetical protein
MYKKRIEITLITQREANEMWDLKVGVPDHDGGRRK